MVKRGATNTVVAKQVQRLRLKRALTTVALAERVGLSKHRIEEIESGHATISVDQLTLLAVALRVSPTTLLLPNERNPKIEAALTGVVAPVGALWEWLTAQSAAATGKRNTVNQETEDNWLWRSHPQWMERPRTGK